MIDPMTDPGANTALFSANTPLAKIFVQETNPWLLAGLLFPLHRKPEADLNGWVR